MKVLIGHRGSGKSELGKRLLKYLPQAKLLDLDLEIEKKTKLPTKELIEKEGIRVFRKLEVEVFQELYTQYGKDRLTFVALGAGFEGAIPADVERLWVRRLSDARGRSFQNRPRLGKNFKSSRDFLETYAARQKKFQTQSYGNELTLREGSWGLNPDEQAFFTGDIHFKNKILSLLPEHFENPNLHNWLKERLQWGLMLELRTDILNEAHWQSVSQVVPQDSLILSIRKNIWTQDAVDAYWIDVDLEELSEIPQTLKPKILSAHRRLPGEGLADFFKRLESKGNGLLLKAAPEIYTWEELKEGYEWESSNPNLRVFLPRTPDKISTQKSLWRWYRLLTSSRQRLSFVREGDGTHIDQPTLLELLALPKNWKNFAAVLGENVDGSYSPSFHEAFFAEQQMPFVAISIPRHENFSRAFSFLDELGLKAAAVTSPYKKDAYAFAQRHDTSAHSLANSLVKDAQGHWHSALTDMVGIKNLIRDIKIDAPVAIWGSGAMSELLCDLFPKAAVFSARNASLVKGQMQDFKYLFWASSTAGEWPEFKPQLVIDLDYTDSAQGLDFAVSTKSAYRSGLDMFMAQAKAQQFFWDQYLK